MMVWFVAIAAVLVIGGAAVVAAGAAGTMADVERPAPWQAASPLTADELGRARFSTALRGYRPDEVDALLDQIRREWTPPAAGEPTAAAAAQVADSTE